MMHRSREDCIEGLLEVHIAQQRRKEAVSGIAKIETARNALVDAFFIAEHRPEGVAEINAALAKLTELKCALSAEHDATNYSAVAKAEIALLYGAPEPAAKSTVTAA